MQRYVLFGRGNYFDDETRLHACPWLLPAGPKASLVTLGRFDFFKSNFVAKLKRVCLKITEKSVDTGNLIYEFVMKAQVLIYQDLSDFSK